MNRINFYLILCMIFVTVFFGCQASKEKYDAAPFEPMGPVQSEQVYGAYSVRTYELNKGFFEILKKGVRVYSGSGYRFEIGSIYQEERTDDPAAANGADITGDGLPNLVVSEWTGGAHCCFLFHIFEIGPHFRYIQTIDAGHADLAGFENLDDDPDLEFHMADWTFAYWKVSFAASPAPSIILKYNGGKYKMACDLMRKPGLSQKDLSLLVSGIKSWQGWRHDPPPSMLWSEMLNLIYTGNMPQAWDLIDLSWPKGIKGKEQFLKEFKLQLQKSLFFESLLEMNKGSVY